MEFFCSNFSIPVIGISYRNLVTNKYRTSKEQRMIGLAIGIGTSRQPFGKKKKRGGLILYTKINSTVVKDLDVNYETICLLEGGFGVLTYRVDAMPAMSLSSHEQG